MKFSLRDLLLAFVIFGLALGWGLDHFRLATKNELMWNVMDEESRTWLLNPPRPGSPEALELFLREVKKPKTDRLKVAAETCFVPGAPAADYASLFAKANRTGDDPGRVFHEFWVEGKAPAEDSWVVVVFVTGNPPVIQKTSIGQWEW